MTTRSLATALAGLQIDYPEAPEVDLAVIGKSRRPLLRWAPAVAAAAAVMVLGFVSPVREAVADWLGIGIIRVEIVDELPPGLGEELDLGVAVDPDPSSGTVWPAGLGQPAGAFDRDGAVSWVWLPSADRPEVGSTGVGALLTRFEGTIDPGVQKSIGEGSTLQVVTLDGRRSYWIEGEPHSFVYLDGDGMPIVETARLAGNTLLWEADGFTWRFESGLGLEVVRDLLEG